MKVIPISLHLIFCWEILFGKKINEEWAFISESGSSVG